MMKRCVLSMSELLQKHIRACLSRAFFDVFVLEEASLRKALSRHAQCWKEYEVFKEKSELILLSQRPA